MLPNLQTTTPGVAPSTPAALREAVGFVLWLLGLRGAGGERL